MPPTDPLALRHGAFITQTWSIIAEARKIALAGPTQAQSQTQLRRLRFMRSKVLALHSNEMRRTDISKPAIDGWFLPVEETLARAEGYFSERLQMITAEAVTPYTADGAPIAASA